MGNAAAHAPNRGFKLPIVFPNKRNLFGVLCSFQHKQLKTLPRVFSVLCTPTGCISRLTPDAGMGQVGRDHLVQHLCSIRAVPEHVAGAHGRSWGCLWIHPVPEQPQPVPCRCLPHQGTQRGRKLVQMDWGGSISTGHSLAVGQRAQVLTCHAGIPCQAVNFLGLAQSVTFTLSTVHLLLQTH